jgi:hypothetical protein
MFTTFIFSCKSNPFHEDSDSLTNPLHDSANMFDKKAFMFNTQRIKSYSEADYVVKFWGPVFESFFGTDEHIFLHWYDYFLFKDKKNGLFLEVY